MQTNLLQPDSDISLGKYFLEAIIPTRLYEHVFLFLVVLSI